LVDYFGWLFLKTNNRKVFVMSSLVPRRALVPFTDSGSFGNFGMEREDPLTSIVRADPDLAGRALEKLMNYKHRELSHAREMERERTRSLERVETLRSHERIFGGLAAAAGKWLDRRLDDEDGIDIGGVVGSDEGFIFSRTQRTQTHLSVRIHRRGDD